MRQTIDDPGSDATLLDMLLAPYTVKATPDLALPPVPPRTLLLQRLRESTQ